MKKSKVIILIFLFLILIVLTSIFLFANFKSKDSISKVKEEREDLMIKENSTVKEASQERIIEMAKKSIEKYENLIPYQESSIGAMPYLLAELNLAEKDELDELVSDIGDTETYVKTNVSYDDFRLALLNYMTGELFDEKYFHYKDIDGYVGIQHVAAGFIPTSVQNIELVSKDYSEAVYTFKVIIRDDEIYEHYLSGEEFEESDYLFEIIIECKYYADYSGETDGVVVVSEYDVETATTERMKNVVLEVLKGTVTKKSLELLITDNNEPTFAWGDNYIIQEKVNDIWQEVLPKKQTEFTDLAYRVNDNNQITQTINFSNYYNLKRNSIYRIVKPVYAGKYVYFYSDEFTIN